jgi:hypothetical protein
MSFGILIDMMVVSPLYLGGWIINFLLSANFMPPPSIFIVLQVYG